MIKILILDFEHLNLFWIWNFALWISSQSVPHFEKRAVPNEYLTLDGGCARSGT